MIMTEYLPILIFLILAFAISIGALFTSLVVGFTNTDSFHIVLKSLMIKFLPMNAVLILLMILGANLKLNFIWWQFYL